MQSVKYLIFLVSILYSQVSIDLPVSFSAHDFTPARISVSNTGTYLLDIENRQIAFIANDGDVLYSGGYGVENDAFVDPIDILTSKLGAWIIDGTENNIISFDHKLNYLNTLEFDEIYPELCGIDDWGNIYLLSTLEEKIYKIDNITHVLYEFIDLSIYSSDVQNPKDLFISEKGNLILLTKDNIFNFNRLGRLINQYEIDGDFKFVFQFNDDLFLISQQNQILNLMENINYDISTENEINDIFLKDNQLFILSTNKIWVINANLE